MPDKTKTTAAGAAEATQAFSEIVANSMGAFGDIGGNSRKAVDAAKASGLVTAQTVEELNRRAAVYSKKAAEDAVAAAKAIATAKSPQQAVELQTNFATQAFNDYIAEFSAVSTLLVDSFSKAMAPYKP